MNSLQDAANIATIVGSALAVVAVIAAVLQLPQQWALGRRQKMVDVYFKCTDTYAELQKERALLEENSAEPQMRRNLIALWDLIAAEHEFAMAQLLPTEIFIGWFRLLHRDLHDNALRFNGITFKTSWARDGAPFAGVIFPRFASLMEVAITQTDGDRVASHLREQIAADQRDSLFKRLR
jgi:hypothetical protein